jgi:hypothetical protein
MKRKPRHGNIEEINAAFEKKTDSQFVKSSVSALRSMYTPSRNEPGAIFLTKDEFYNQLSERFLSPKKYEELFKNKFSTFLFLAEFIESFSKVDNKTVRGYWVVKSNGDFDASEMNLPEFDKNENLEIITFRSMDSAFDYVIKNWWFYNQYMPDDILNEYLKNPEFIKVSNSKIEKILHCAGFTERYVGYKFVEGGEKIV